MRWARAGLLGDQRLSRTSVIARAWAVAAMTASLLMLSPPDTHAETLDPSEPIAALAVGATYLPCSTVTWAYDQTGEPSDVSNLRADIGAALRMLGTHTGLTFVVAEPGSVPDILYGWGALSEYAPGTQAVAWASGVTLAVDSELMNDRWAGFRRRAVPVGDGSQDIGSGRGWLIVHETMHSLGFDHSNERGSVMAPRATITNVVTRADRRRELRADTRPGFSAGDKAAMAALYPTGGCLRP